ncbi:MAG TPA: glycosyltransferase family 4 protein [Candidatus Hydrogenedentes bacterium]|nr:glycosyltransferase family 4 protein [Candidatus Hydrogenedentota bacterium]HPG65512.1 glycosyltransferase family 4 protein [Candidatus Hydrogenedentota bacterium]
MDTAQKNRPPLRVACCHYSADTWGGSDKALYDFATRLPRDAFTPILILKRGDPMAKAYRAAEIEVIEIPFVPPRRALEWGKLARFALGFWPSTFRVAWTLRRIRADVVHVNTLFNLQGAIGARLAGRPLVWHVREIVPDSRMAQLMLALVPHLATRAVAISSAVRDTLARCGDRLRVVFDGIDLAPFESSSGARRRIRAELGIVETEPLVATIGRIEPWKGQHVFVEAAPAILAQFPSARFLVVGTPAVNKPQYYHDLRARCRELAIEERFVFTGVRHDVPKLLAASDVLVLPSVTPEPFGLTVIEAMAAARPVVATAAGGPLDTVLDGKTGFLTSPHSADALAQAVCRVLEAPELARDLGVSGRERARQLFSIERVAREMADVLAEAAGYPIGEHTSSR